MTEDEAFVRAIVSAPGDDLPRLVYADWLDERNDPRGAYLRAEVEWAKTKQTTGFLVFRLHGLAEGLDPVWVARVSRPPQGVCCETPRISQQGPQLSRGDLAAAEQKLDAQLPTDFVAFMLNYNGGTPVWSTDASHQSNELDEQAVQSCWFCRIEAVRRWGMRPDDLLTEEDRRHLPPLDLSVPEWLARYVIVGHDPDMIGEMFLGVSGPDRGHVRVLDTSVEIESGIRAHYGQPPNAVSFSAFMATLWEPRYTHLSH